MSWRWTLSSAPDQIQLAAASLESDFPGRVVVSRMSGKKRDQLDLYLERKPPAWLQAWGGTLTRYSTKDILRSQASTHPIRVNGSLSVIPDVHAREMLPAGVVGLLIPAGAAFGTGDHATTGMILRALGRLPALARESLLDVGTGTGILAIVARQLGFKDVIAFDNDPIAVRIAKENEKLNFKRPLIQWSIGDLAAWKAPRAFSLMTANVYGAVLKKYVSVLSRGVKPGGMALLSGILAAESDDVIATWQKFGWICQRRARKGKWTMLTLRKQLKNRRD